MSTSEVEIPVQPPRGAASLDLSESAEASRVGRVTVVTPPRLSPARAAIAFLPAVAAGIALAVHKFVPDGQSTETAGLYARFLIGVIIAGLVLGFTQRGDASTYRSAGRSSSRSPRSRTSCAGASQTPTCWPRAYCCCARGT
jgi:hypothetical protein